MERRIKFTKVEKYDVNPKFDMDNSKIYTPSVATEFEIIEHKNVKSDDSISLTTDVQMLLRQQELVNRDPGFVREYMDKMIADFADATNKAKAMESLKTGLTDDQLFKYIKPRHIQSATELKTYGKYILDEAIGSDSAIKSMIADIKAIKPEVEETKTE